MKYCTNCGEKLSGNERFCPNCGRFIPPGSFSHYQNKTYHHTVKQEPTEKLVCELAYSGFNFWLPLVFGKKDDYSRKIANQGLWTLIMAFVACTLIRAFKSVNIVFKGTLFFSVSNAIYGLAYIIFLGFMMFLLYKCLRNVKAIHQNRPIEKMFFFDDIRIIRETTAASSDGNS